MLGEGGKGDRGQLEGRRGVEPADKNSATKDQKKKKKKFCQIEPMEPCLCPWGKKADDNNPGPKWSTSAK